MVLLTGDDFSTDLFYPYTEKIAHLHLYRLFNIHILFFWSDVFAPVALNSLGAISAVEPFIVVFDCLTKYADFVASKSFFRLGFSRAIPATEKSMKCGNT